MHMITNTIHQAVEAVTRPAYVRERGGGGGWVGRWMEWVPFWYVFSVVIV